MLVHEMSVFKSVLKVSKYSSEHNSGGMFHKNLAERPSTRLYCDGTLKISWMDKLSENALFDARPLHLMSKHEMPFGFLLRNYFFIFLY